MRAFREFLGEGAVKAAHRKGSKFSAGQRADG